MQSSAKQRVIQTYELLEHVLGHLDPHSLRQAALVDRDWNTIIRNSSTLLTCVTESNKPRELRTVLVGMRSCGITGLVDCFDSLSPPWRSSSLWDAFFEKAITVDGERWMLRGSTDGYLDDETHAALVGHMLTNSETYMLIYSVDSRESFNRLKAWLASMNSATEPLSMLVANHATPSKNRSSGAGPKKCIPAALVSTKNTIAASTSTRDVSQAEGAAFARELGCPFIETSTRTGAGVQEAFAEVCRTYKRVRLEELRKRSKRSSLTKAIAPHESNERKERWWRWYGAKQRRGG